MTTVRYNSNPAVDTMNALNARPNIVAANQEKVSKNLGEKQLNQNMNDFLNLLIVQLKNQDPLSPLDANDLVAQLVQFSTVEQALNTNKKLDELITIQQTNQSIEAMRFIGQTVGYEGDTFNYDGNKPDILFSLSQEAPEVRINIYDSGNRLVQVERMSGKIGQHRIEFNGRDLMDRNLDHGAYLVEVQAVHKNGTPLYDEDGDAIKIPIYLSGRVTNIEKVQTSPVLALGQVQVPMNKILSVRETPLTQVMNPSEDSKVSTVTEVQD